jgi:hypothetical protein
MFQRLLVAIMLWSLGQGGAVQAAPPIRLISASSTSAVSRTEAGGAFLRGTLWETVAARHGLDPHWLYGVALQESRRRAGPGHAQPWPYTLRSPEGSQFHHSKAEAAHALRQLLTRHPPRAIDVGLLQINLHWHGRRVRAPEDLLEARTNLELGARLLAEAVGSAPDDLALGLGRYHHWRDSSRARAYGRRVLAMAAALEAGARPQADHPDGR